MILPPGAFLTLGILIGMMNTLSGESFRMRFSGSKAKNIDKASELEANT